MSARPHPCLASTLLVTCLSASVGTAEDFRLETAIHVGSEEKPASENMTIFAGHMVYDFLLGEPREITIFNTRSRQFTLMDLGRDTKTQLSDHELLRFMAAVRVRAKAAGPLVRFAAEPQFDEAFDAASQRLTLTGSMLSYRAVLFAPGRASAVSQYVNFADWYARLNATRPQSLPPDARIALNQALTARGRLPRTVELVVRRQGQEPPDANGRRDEFTVRSQHSFSWQLDREDYQRIKLADDTALRLEAVAFDAYRRRQFPQRPGGPG